MADEQPLPPPPPQPALVRDGGKVAIRDEDGSVSMVAAGDLDAAVAEGARPATETEWANAKLGRAGEIASAAVGAGHAGTFGLGTPLIAGGLDAIGAHEAAEDFRRGVKLAKETSPNAFLAGEVAGSLLPSGAAGKVGEGAALAERGLARAGQRALQAAPHALATGAAIGVGEQATEDTLENRDFAASAYLSAAAKGGAIGLLLGGALSAGAGAAGDRLSGPLFGRRGVVAAEGLSDDVARPALARSAETAAEDIAAREGQRGAAAWLDKQASTQAFKSTGAKVGDVRRLASTVEEQQAEIERIGSRLRNEKVDGKALVEATASQSEIAKRITQRAGEVGQELSKLRGELDKAAARPSMSTIAERFESEVVRPTEAMPLGEADVVAAKTYLADMVKKGGEAPSFEQLHQFRRRLDDKLAKEYSAPPGIPVPPGKESMMALRTIVEDEFTLAGERASKEIGSEFASKYKLTKELYADLATARKIAKAEAERNAGANFVSITDVILGVAGGLEGAGLAAANQVRRKFGNQIAAHVLGKASKLFAVEDAAVKLDASLNKATRSFVAGEKSVARETRKVTADEVRAIRDVVRSPEIVQSRIEAALGDMPKYAPKTAAAIATRMATVAALLRDTLPKEPPPTMLKFGPQKTRPMSDSELLRASQVIETVEDPTIVVDRLLQGRLSRAHVEALKVAHQDVYAKIQTYLQEHGAELRRKLPVQQQVALSLFFGEPVTAAMLPENVRAFQATFAGGTQAPAPDMSAGGAGLPVRGLKDVGKVGTVTDQLERGEP